MGVLYYFAKADDSRELFALNKVYGYALWPDDPVGVGMPIEDAFKEPTTIHAVVSSPSDFAARFIEPHLHDWGERIGARLFAWAGETPIRFMSEYEVDDLHDDLEPEAHWDLITGSAYDSDYEDDGTTYRRGSAW